jgi:hypothetical protein
MSGSFEIVSPLNVRANECGGSITKQNPSVIY